MVYKIIFDLGKPYEEIAKDEKDLKKKLKKFYLENRQSGYYYNAEVFFNGEDISESQFITEMIGGFLEWKNKKF